MSASSPSPRRRLDVQQRRAAILQAAREVYSEQPYGTVPTAVIAKACGASPSLVFHYFGSKAGLYAEVIRGALGELEAAQEQAISALSPGVPVRDRVREALSVYLDHIAAGPTFWGVPLRGGEEPPEAQAVRSEARARYMERLGELLGVGTFPRHLYAIAGFYGFIDQACARWVQQGCPADQRDLLLDAALGALEGGLGDWRV